MLRNLLLALLAANLLYFAWAHWVDAPAKPPPGSAAADSDPAAARAPASGAVTGAAPTAAGSSDDAATPASSAATASLPVGPPLCTSLGPFSDGVAADRAAALLAGAGKPSRPRSAAMPQADGYWVYVGGFKDAAAQRRILAAIKRSGIDDSFAMPDDPQFRVSVGIFSERERAEQRARRVRLLQLDPQIEEHFRLQATQWLDFAGVAPAALQPPQLAALGITDAALTAVTCP